MASDNESISFSAESTSGRATKIVATTVDHTHLKLTEDSFIRDSFESMKSIPLKLKRVEENLPPRTLSPLRWLHSYISNIAWTLIWSSPWFVLKFWTAFLSMKNGGQHFTDLFEKEDWILQGNCHPSQPPRSCIQVATPQRVRLGRKISHWEFICVLSLAFESEWSLVSWIVNEN